MTHEGHRPLGSATAPGPAGGAADAAFESDAPLLRVGRDGRIVAANAPAERCFGYAAGRLTGRPVTDLLDLDWSHAWRPAHRDGLRGRREDGASFAAEASTMPDADGGALSVLVRDVTEREREAEDLRARERLLRDVVEHGKDLFYCHTVDHVLTYVSPQTRAFFGCEPEEALTRWTEFATDHPENARGVEATERAIATGRPQPPYLLELHGREGRRIWVEVREAPVVRDGRTLGVVGALTDVTDRLRAEEEARRRERQLADAQRIAGFGSWSWDSTTDRAVWSDELYRIHGIGEGDFDGTFAGYLALVHPEDRERVGATISRALDAKARFTFDCRVTRPDGAVRVHHVEGDALPDPNGGTTLVGVCHDVTERQLAEAALRESEERFRLLAENAHDVIARVRIQPEFGFEYLSPSIERLSGYGPDDFYTDPFLATRILHAEDRDRMSSLDFSAPAGRPVEFRIVRRDGAVVWVEQQAKLVRDASGEPVALESIVRDITARKRVEGALRASEERWRTLAEHAPDFVCLLDPDGAILFLNRRIGGRDPQEIIGRSIFDFVAASDAARIREAHERVLASGHGETYEVSIPAPEGGVLWFRSHVGPLERDGVVTALVVVSADITDRKAMEEALRRQTNVYKALLQAQGDLGEGFLVVEDDRVSYANEGFCRITGRTQDELAALESYLDVVDAGARRAVRENAATLAARGAGDTHLETALVHKSGRRVDVEMAVMPLELEGRPQLAIICRDITVRKRAEAELEDARRQAAAREKLSALGTLVAGVAHEINNPLQFMTGTAQLIEAGLHDELAAGRIPVESRAAIEQAVKDAETLLTGIERIAHITTSLKRIARVGNGARAAEDVNALADSVLTVAGATLRVGHRVRRDLAATRAAWACGPEIAQVLLNLVLNANEAMSGAPGEITVRTFDSPDGVAIEVEDTGPGIPESAREKVFTPFFTTKARGTGLGLSVSHGIVEAHGGRLSFRTEPGRGTTFRVDLPAAARSV